VTSTCGICGNTENKFILRQENLPVFQNALCDNYEKAISVPRGTLNLVICTNCGFLWNSNSQHGSEDFDPSYESDQTFSPAFSEHVDKMISRVVTDIPEKTVFLEIGAGQGYFLKRLMQASGHKFHRGYGFDKVWRDAQTEEKIQIFPHYFDTNSHKLLEAEIDIVVCRHVLEYIIKPVEFMKSVRNLFSNDKLGRVYFETRCTDWSLDNNLSEDFCYEECAYENSVNLKNALELAGFNNVRVDKVFDGQYLWAQADTEANPFTSNFDQSEYINSAVQFGKKAISTIQNLRKQISKLSASGPVAMWGAATKGVALATTIDPEGELLSCLIDMSPHKQGTFVPASGQKIVSPQEAAKLNVRNIIISNESYTAEIEAYIEQEQLPFIVRSRVSS
jgi:Methyltransferase domain/C-methyltransferase C-terminal domain